VIRPLDPETDAPGVVDLIHEVFPAGTTTTESWLQQQASVPARARNAEWVAIVDGTVAGRAEATLKWFSDTGSAFAGVSVHPAFRRRGIGRDLWEVVQQHLDVLAPSRVFTMFTETPEGVAFARARGFAEVRAETVSCVDPRTVEVAALESDSTRLVSLRDVPAEEVYEVDMITTADVPTSEAVTNLPFDEWLDMIWRRPTITFDGSLCGDRGRSRRLCHDARRQHCTRSSIQRVHRDAAGLPAPRARGAGETSVASLGRRQQHPGGLDDERRDERGDACAQ
jgi:N-acetylglutamate synthase-like GNAT family acetyltransferase